MLQRNRKRASLHYGVIAKSLLACLYVAAVGVGFVWYKNQLHRLGDEIKKRCREYGYRGGFIYPVPEPTRVFS
jgi:hypothetical protein